MNYNEIIRKEIAKDFGLESAGYAPAKMLSITIAQRINAKYPISSDNLEMGVSPKAKYIAKRYFSLFGGTK